MKKTIRIYAHSLFILLFFFIQNIYCQNFIGKITDKSDNPIYGSTVFIKENNQGLACNDVGQFQTTLPKGNYSVEYRCLGYETVEEKISIDGKNTLERTIILSEKTFELPEITVSSKEDPAYEIMRNAIKRAPYHLNRIKEYEAEAYIKGNMELQKVSGFINSLAGEEEGMRLSDIKDKLFLQESYSKIKFTAPDKYEQNVEAFSSTIPDDFNPEDAMIIMRGSLYSPRFGNMISPLNPKAFSYYRFRYEGFSEDEGQIINKIKIIPKLKDAELTSGYIYIADNTWDIRQAELSSNIYGINQDFIIVYNEVSDNLYLPVTYSSKIYGSIMGIGGYFNYYSSIKYNSVLIDESAEEIIKKEKKKKKNLEIKFDEFYSVKTDSLATKRDSLFWINIRNVPLNEKEIHSYEIKDSIQHHIDSVRKDFHNSKFEPMDILIGGKIGGDSTKVSFSFDGLLRAIGNYNFVDGFWLGQKFSLATKWNNHNNSLIISPEFYYATARKRLIWQTAIALKYAPMKLGELNISFGDISTDYNPTGVNSFDDMVSILFWGKNKRMLYRKRYIKLYNKVDLANGLQLITQFQIAKRHGLINNTQYSFFGGKNQIKSNIDMPYDFDLTSYGIGLIYTPRYYYTVKDGKKYYRYAESPTLYALYSEGFSSWQTNNSKFRKLDMGIVHFVRTDLFSHILYEVSGGTFLGNKKHANFADYKHFNTSDVILMTKSPFRSFLLLDGYEASTNDYWMQAHFNYYSKYILLKRLPFLQGKLFNEAVHLKYLYTPSKKNYTEAGYSLDIMEVINTGVYFSFDKFKYESFGIRISFNTGLFK